MQDIIYYSYNTLVNNTIIYEADTSDNDISNFRFKYCDSIQNIINVYIKSPFFPWVCLILLLNEGKWKRPVNLVLIGHWFLRATGDLLRNLMQLYPIQKDYNWPYSQTNWFVSNAAAHVFWLAGEIVGDWYLLIRTKAVTNNSRKLKYVYITCLLFNMLKVAGMLCYFIHIPIDLRIRNEKDELVTDLIDYNIAWWSVVLLIEVASCLYNIAVVNALKSILFKKLDQSKLISYTPNEYTNQNDHNKGNELFIEKFKKLSEYRITISMIISIIFLPFVIVFVIMLIRQYVSTKSSDKYILQDGSVEQLRQVILGFNYNFIYIDQILLRRLVEKRKLRPANFMKKKSPDTVVIHSKAYKRYDNLNTNNNKSFSLSSPTLVYPDPIVSPDISIRSSYEKDNDYSFSFNNYNTTLTNNNNNNNGNGGSSGNNSIHHSSINSNINSSFSRTSLSTNANFNSNNKYNSKLILNPSLFNDNENYYPYGHTSLKSPQNTYSYNSNSNNNNNNNNSSSSNSGSNGNGNGNNARSSFRNSQRNSSNKLTNSFSGGSPRNSLLGSNSKNSYMSTSPRNSIFHSAIYTIKDDKIHIISTSSEKKISNISNIRPYEYGIQPESYNTESNKTRQYMF